MYMMMMMMMKPYKAMIVAFCVKNSILDEPIAEAACIVADLDEWWAVLSSIVLVHCDTENAVHCFCYNWVKSVDFQNSFTEYF